MPRRVVILGSTGSIGRSALSVIEGLTDELTVQGLSGWRRWEALAEQAVRFRPAGLVVETAEAAAKLRDRLAHETFQPTIGHGPDGLLALVRDPRCEFVLTAIVGAAGLPAVLEAVNRGLPIGVANKEPLVVAGALLTARARRTGSRLIPIDSEHSAVFQALHAGRPGEVSRIYLTSSGGPFRTWPADRIQTATLQDALNHPTWSMGPKITVDSATMMNKALEIIEARWLFDVDPDCIEVVVHPESIIHSMVEFCDGSIIAQLGAPDMCMPIQYALT
ncbi:MAG: 1-deoxy-D-xylulose-5-phosphate reductoisomerase, partial [Phycisphaerae bacterium]